MKAKLPPLTILVVDKAGRPGSGFIAWDVADLDTGYAQVYGHNWQNERNPFEYAAKGGTVRGIASALHNGDLAPSEAYARVKVRGVVQDVFRAALLTAYESRCAVCGLAYPIALDAAHIKPWADCDNAEKLDVCNGVLLCRNHHALFDSGTLSLSPDWIATLAGSPKQLASSGHQNGRLGRLRLPREVRHRPSAKYLRERLHKHRASARA